ncbi:MAG: hypothetical protein CV089_02100 [Nitrospira sp. WS110]|nr:hypothetical protein [Nitrospira sp. WS110]
MPKNKPQEPVPQEKLDHNKVGGRPRKAQLPVGSDQKKVSHLRNKAAVLADRLLDDLERIRKGLRDKPPSRECNESVQDYLARVKVWASDKPDTADLDRCARAAGLMFDKVTANTEDTGLTIRFPKQLASVLKIGIAIQAVPRLAGAVTGVVTADGLGLPGDEENQADTVDGEVVSVTVDPAAPALPAPDTETGG